MYRILIVDDEPMACTAIELLLKKEFRELFSCAKAFNGSDALQIAESEQPDIVITDIRMPVMDGLELAKQFSSWEQPPVIIIVSGYSDFTYARTAMQYNVVDYLLKPIVRDEFFSCISKILCRFRLREYEERKYFLKSLCSGEKLDSVKLCSCFPDSHYYLALVRYGALPTRFSHSGSQEIFSEPQDLILTYGRDDREALYICSKDLLSLEEFKTQILKKADYGCGEPLTYTLLFLNVPVTPEQLQSSAQLLFKELLRRVVIGTSSVHQLPESIPTSYCSLSGETHSLFLLEKYCTEGNISKVRGELQQLFHFLAEGSYSQLMLEEIISNIQFLLKKYHLFEQRKSSEETFLISEALYNAENMTQLSENLMDIFFPTAKEIQEEKLDSYTSYEKILKYISLHFREPLTLQSTCRTLGISQTYLSMIMRKYGNDTFKNVLTKTRMEYAKKIMETSNRQLKIKDISEQCGFHDQFQFSKVFRAYTGISPSDYLEQLSSRLPV